MYCKGSLTVEASMVIGICMVVIGLCLILGFDIYHEAIGYIKDINVPDIDAVKKFKQIQMGKEILDSVIY